MGSAGPRRFAHRARSSAANRSARNDGDHGYISRYIDDRTRACLVWRGGHPSDNHVVMAQDETAPQDSRSELINVSVWHGSLDRAREILAAHPELASSDIDTAALLGDFEAVARFLNEDPANATAKGGPRNWDALTHLCFSKFLRCEPARTEGFLKAASALLDAGSNPNTGFFE